MLRTILQNFWNITCILFCILLITIFINFILTFIVTTIDMFKKRKIKDEIIAQLKKDMDNFIQDLNNESIDKDDKN